MTEPAYEKQYVFHSLENIPIIESDVRYKSLDELGEVVFIETLRKCMIGIAARDFDPGSPQKQFKDLASYAGSNFLPQNWLIAYRGEDIVGMVLPQSYGEDSPGDGSLFFIGIVPEFRKQGLGRILHARGLHALSEMGLKRYIGSTDIINIDMLAIFRANGCDFYKIRMFDQAGEHIDWRE